LAETLTLSASRPWAANSLEEPETVKPVDSTVIVRENAIELNLPPYTMMRVRIPPQR